MAAEGKTIDALSQFELTPVLGAIGSSVGFTQSNAFMVVAVALVALLFICGTRAAAIVPGRTQAAAEIMHGFVHELVLRQVGPEGKRFFPFVFAIFSFVLMGNVLGLFPYAFTFTSHIAVTFALAMIVFVMTTILAISLHGWHFLSLFFPKGVSIWLAPIIIPVEILSYLSRPVSLSVRLFANMVAGHVLLKVFATFMLLLAGFGALGVFSAIVPLGINVLLIGFELLVAFLQAYVFAILTSIYLHDAVHLH